MKQIFLIISFFFFGSILSQNNNKSIGFIENKGQIMDQTGKSNNDVKFLLNTGGLNVQLRKNGFSYDVYEVEKIPLSNSQTRKTLPDLTSERDNPKRDYSLEYKFHRIDIDFVNSNSKVELITDKKSKDFDNYYNIPNKPEGITGVYKYSQITYKNIYPDIDVVFTIPEDPKKSVEYNFVIHPKGKISNIQLKFNGAETNLVDNKIQMNVRFGKMEETIPSSWIEEKGFKKEIIVGYQKLKKNVYGFRSANFLNGKTIVIDPTPVRLWGTYYGGTYLTNEPNSINFDSQGNTIFSGSTENSSGIATSGAFQSNNTTFGSAFMAKLNSNGVRIWGTYIGGSGIQSAKINSQDEIYIGGYASFESGLSTPGTFKEVLDSTDGLLMKFDSNGQRIWGTYFGGKNFERIDALSLDINENIIIAGETHSLEGIATSNAFQRNLNASPDLYSGFFAKFDKSGNRIYGSYFPVVIKCSTVDKNNNVYFAGNKYVDDFFNYYPNISTPGAFKTTQNSVDAFLTKFDPNFTRIWSTYYGGDKSNLDTSQNSDLIGGIGCDDLNNVYIVGSTNSLNGISTPGAFKISQNVGSQNAFIAKFDSSGNRTWGTYFGGNTSIASDFGTNCFITPEGNIYLIGYTNSQSNIATSDSFQTFLKNGPDGYIAKLSATGELNWSTYYGGKGGDYLQSIDYKNGKIGVTGRTIYDGSKDLSTPGTHKENGGGFIDIFVAEFQDCELLTKVESNSPICIGKKLELKASGGTDYLWTGPNGFTSTEQNPTIVNASLINSGEYSCLITGTGSCDDTKKITVFIGDAVAPVPNLSTLPTITGDCTTTITSTPIATDACDGPITGQTTSPLSFALPGTYTIVWNYTDGNGNTSTQNQTVVITSQPLPTANPLQTFCVDQNAGLNDIQITGQNIKWYSNLTGGTVVPTTTVLQDKATYYASQTINGCESERVPVKINIQVTFPPAGNVNQSFCTGQNPAIANLEITGTTIKWYDALTNGNLLSETTALQNGKTYYASQTENNCEGPRLGITISIVNTPSVPSGNPEQSFCKKDKKTLNDIQISGQNIKWFDTGFSATALPNTTLLENNRTYYVSQTIGCESDRTPILVHIYDTPLPTGNSNQQFCIDEIATIENLNIGGTALKWYDTAINGSILPETTLLESRVYYVSQTQNDCESERLPVTVKIQDTQIPTANSIQQFCIQKKTKISDIEIIGQNIKWYESISATNNLAESTLLENGITYYASQTISNCESDKIPVTINILEATDRECINLTTELPFPKFFTPNGDGFNDTWTIDSAYLAPNSSIRIFDRYGKFIKELSLNTSWDGTYLGHLEPASDYWFTVIKLNGTEFRGHFTLKR